MSNEEPLMYSQFCYYIQKDEEKRRATMHKLINERIDILLLADDSTEPLGKQYASVRIPYEKTKMLVTTLGLTVENPDEEKWIRVVWKKSLKSKNRDRVITALEMEHCRLKCGYADYLD